MKRYRRSKARILFVEDDEFARTLVSTKLEVWGYKPESASTMSDAVKLIENGKYDLILLDWYFEDGTGIELCEMIRSFDTETPILFYTGVSLEAKLEKARKAGAQGFIGKPIEMDDFVKAVRKYVHKHKVPGKGK